MTVNATTVVYIYFNKRWAHDEIDEGPPNLKETAETLPTWPSKLSGKQPVSELHNRQCHGNFKRANSQIESSTSRRSHIGAESHYANSFRPHTRVYASAPRASVKPPSILYTVGKTQICRYPSPLHWTNMRRLRHRTSSRRLYKNLSYT